MRVANPIWLNVLMLTLSISLIQWHSIQFWMEATGIIGPLWSVAIEAAALWLWWQRRIWLACLSSIILALGPLSFLAIPAYEAVQLEKQRQESVVQQKALLQSSITQLTTALDSYHQTSQSRLGWAARIDETQTALQNQRTRYENLLIETQHQHRNTLPYLIVSIETLAISILMLTQILALHALRNVSISKRTIETVGACLPETLIPAEDRVSTLSKQIETTDEEFETNVTDVSKNLAELLKVETISQAEWARRNGISKKSVSMLLNHSKRKTEGKECISRNELRHISQCLL